MDTIHFSSEDRLFLRDRTGTVFLQRIWSRLGIVGTGGYKCDDTAVSRIFREK